MSCRAVTGNQYLAGVRRYAQGIASAARAARHRSVHRGCGRRSRGYRSLSPILSPAFDGDWAEVFRSTDVHDAELAKSLLEDAQYHIETQNFGSIGYAWDGGGDNPQSRSNLNNPAKIFVPIDEYLKAKEALDDWRNASIDNTSIT